MMNDFLTNLLPIVAILSTIALPIVLGMYLAIKSEKQKHLERMEMIKQGLIPPSSEKKAPNRLRSLRNAVLLIGIGLGIAIGILIVRILGLDEEHSVWVVGPSVLIFLGASYLLYFSLSKKYKETEED